MRLLNSILLATTMTFVMLAPSAHAETMYIFKNSGGQTLLTNVGRPSGNFKRFNQQIGKKKYITRQRMNYHSRSNYGYPKKYGYSSHSSSANRNRYDGLILSASSRYGVDPALVKAIIHTESNFRPNARSNVGAQGLMQLMPGTARELRVLNPWNPAENIDGGTRYIASLLRQFNNDAELALAGYNAGPNRRSLREGRIPNIRETQNYVRSVLSRYHNLYKNDPSLGSKNDIQSNNNSNKNVNSGGIKKVTFINRGTDSSGSSNIGTSDSYTQSAFDALR